MIGVIAAILICFGGIMYTVWMLGSEPEKHDDTDEYGC